MLYYKFSDYLKNTYGEKVYKIPINLPVTCPNRDGTKSSEGCIFCGDEGAGFECLSEKISVKEQISKNIQYIGKNYNAKKYIAYFQNYTNTYMPIQDFKRYIQECLCDDVLGIYISTRPDCIYHEYLEFLGDIKQKYNVDILVELGIQTVNYHSLKILNRGHSLAEFIKACIDIKKYGILTCAHYIIDLPFDNLDDVIEGAKIISALEVDQVKCHSLYILKGTKLEEMYNLGVISPLELEQYIERIITFLEYLDPKIVIQRLLGRAPKDRTVFCNWGMSWWKIKDQIEDRMTKDGRCQGRLASHI